MERIPILSELTKLAGGGGFTIVNDLGSLVSNIVGLLLIIASVATFVYLVMGGLKWLTAGSDKGKVEEAKSQLTNAIIGLAIVAASWAVFLILNYFFGLGIAGTAPSNNSLASVGYCSCGNNQCRFTNAYTGRGDINGQCYYCDTQKGTWRTVPGDLSCADDILKCSPCPTN